MILVLSGTKDGRELVKRLHSKKYQLLITTATDYGKDLINRIKGISVISKRLDYQEMVDLINNKGIKLVIDATHPYAEEVSKNSYRACKELNIPYIRYQRQDTDFEKYLTQVQFTANYEEAAKLARDIGGNVLLTTGSKTLDIFAKEISAENIYPRVLPMSTIIKKCELINIKPSNIIAIQGPFSVQMNVEIIKKYNINILITKDSGKIGGTLEKLEAAKLCGINTIIISRPDTDGEYIFKTPEEIIDKVSEIYG